MSVEVNEAESSIEKSGFKILWIVIFATFIIAYLIFLYINSLIYISSVSDSRLIQNSLLRMLKSVVINCLVYSWSNKKSSKLECPRHCNGMPHVIQGSSSSSWLLLSYPLLGLPRPFFLFSLLLLHVSVPPFRKVRAFDSFSRRLLFSLHFWQGIYY